MIKERITIRLDKEIIEFFKDGGLAGYQTRINEVLLNHISTHTLCNNVGSNVYDIKRVKNEQD